MTVALCTYHPPVLTRCRVHDIARCTICLAPADNGAAAAQRARCEHESADTAKADKRFAAWRRRHPAPASPGAPAAPAWEVIALAPDGSTRCVTVGSFADCADSASARSAHPSAGRTRFVVVLAQCEE